MDKSFLKWAGGKLRALPEVLPVLNSLVEEQKSVRFVEPFFGSGVVSLNMNLLDSFYVNDLNADLITLFLNLKNDESFIDALSGFFSEKTNDVIYFKEIVSRFNGTKDLDSRALMFLYLNKHCFNGLMRYNKKGAFNTPFGTYDNVSFPKDNLERYKKKISSNNFEFTNTSYQEVFKNVKNADLIYCDPPYVNLDNTSSNSFNLYGEIVFSSEDQKNLVELSKEAVSKGATVVISNHYTEETKELYKDASSIKVFNVSRSIAASGAKRKSVSEVLAVYK